MRNNNTVVVSMTAFQSYQVLFLCITSDCAVFLAGYIPANFGHPGLYFIVSHVREAGSPHLPVHLGQGGVFACSLKGALDSQTSAYRCSILCAHKPSTLLKYGHAEQRARS